MQLVRAHEGPQMHLLRRAGELLYLGLISLVFFQLLLEAALPLLHIEAVVAAVKLCAPLVYFYRALHDLVQKPPVVAYHQHRALEVQQVILKPFGRVQVKVVRRLVQQEYVRVLQYQPREVHARFLAAGQT